MFKTLNSRRKDKNYFGNVALGILELFRISVFEFRIFELTGVIFPADSM